MSSVRMVVTTLNIRKNLIISSAVLVAAIALFPKYWDGIFFLIIIMGIHEAGHYFAARKSGYQAELNLLFPFFAGIKIKDKITHQRNMIWLIIAGPVPGMLIGALLIGIAYWLSSHYLHWVGAGFVLLNVLNSIPIFPLDGFLIWSYLLSFSERGVIILSTLSAIITGTIMVHFSAYLLMFLFIYQVLFILASIYFYKEGRSRKVITLQEYLDSKKDIVTQLGQGEMETSILVNDLSKYQGVWIGLMHLILTGCGMLFLFQFLR